MRQYELTVLIHPDLEMNTAPATDKVKKLISDNGGKLVSETSDGKKRLSYQIGGQEYAVFYYYEVELPPEAPNKMKSVLNITDEIIRYELDKTDPRKAKMAARRKERKGADEDEAEAEEGGTEQNNEE